MFKKKTTLVLGAGASHEVLMPTGEELSKQIAYKLRYTLDPTGNIHGGDPSLLNVLRRRAKKENVGVLQYCEAAQNVSKGVEYSRSIDEFVNKHKDDERIQFCAKLAIAQTIAEAETGSHLFINEASGETNFARLGKMPDTWFFDFVRFLYDGASRQGLESIFDNLSIVNFNYDRCVEHYLFHTLQNSFAVSPEIAASALSRLNIFHPYGSLGHLPWQSGEPGLPFGANLTESTLPNVALRIRTFFEQLDDHALILRNIGKAITQAERVIFLGFGFHPQNMTLISAGDTNIRWVAATAFGESESAIEIIRTQIKHSIGNSHLNRSEYVYVNRSMRCSELLREYSRILSN